MVSLKKETADLLLSVLAEKRSYEPFGKDASLPNRPPLSRSAVSSLFEVEMFVIMEVKLKEHWAVAPGKNSRLS